MATEPNISVQIAWEAGPMDRAPAWSDITEHVRGFRVDRGRNMELDEFQTGTMSVDLDNTDGRFTPGNTSSPHYPYVTPKRPVRITASGDPTGFEFHPSYGWESTGNGSFTWLPTYGDYRITPNATGDAFYVFHSPRIPFSGDEAANIDVTATWVSSGPGTAYVRAWFYDESNGITGVTILGASNGVWTNGQAGPTDVFTLEPSAAPEGTVSVRIGFGFASAQAGAYLILTDADVARRDIPVGFGYVERWPVQIGGGSATTTLSLVDGFSVLAGIEFPNSDTGFIENGSPLSYVTFDGSSDDSWRDVVDGGRAARILPVNGPGATWTNDAPSLLPSGAGASVDTGPRESPAGFMRGNVVEVTEVAGGLGRFHSTQPMTACVYFCIEGHQPDGSAIVSVIGPSGSRDLEVRVEGTSAGGNVGRLVVECQASGMFSYAFAAGDGVVPGTNYMLVIESDPVEKRVYTWLFNGTRWRYWWLPFKNDVSLAPWQPRKAYLGGALTSSAFGYKANARFSHFAVFDRSMDEDEVRSLYGGWLTQPGMTETDRLERLADLVNFPPVADLDDGLSALNRDSWSDGTNALALAQKWVGSSGGNLFMDASGALVYHNRHRRYTAPEFAVFDEEAGTGVEAGLEFEVDAQDVRNVVFLDVLYGAKATLKDAESIALYGERPHEMKLDIQSDAEGYDAAAMMLGRYATPPVRLNTVSVRPSAHADGSLWGPSLRVEVGSRVRITNLPDYAPAPELSYLVESVQHSASVNGGVVEWLTTLRLSPAFLTSAWVLEDAERGALGSGTVVVY